MRRILLDQNVPRGVRTALSAHDIRTAPQMGWDALSNGELIEAAERAGIDVMVIADRNIRHQQNLSGRRLAVVVLETNHWDVIRSDLARLEAAVNVVAPGGYVSVAFTTSTRRRRPSP